MSVLPKRRVGKTKLEVTTLGLGVPPIPSLRASIPHAEATALTLAARRSDVVSVLDLVFTPSA